MGKGAKIVGGIMTMAFTYYWITQVFSDAAYVFNLNDVSDMAYRLSGIFALIFIAATFIYAVATKNKTLLVLFLILSILFFLGVLRWI